MVQVSILLAYLTSKHWALVYVFLFKLQAKELTDIAGHNPRVQVLTLDVKNFDEFDSFAQKVIHNLTSKILCSLLNDFGVDS